MSFLKVERLLYGRSISSTVRRTRRRKLIKTLAEFFVFFITLIVILVGGLLITP